MLKICSIFISYYQLKSVAYMKPAVKILRWKWTNCTDEGKDISRKILQAKPMVLTKE